MPAAPSTPCVRKARRAAPAFQPSPSSPILKLQTSQQTLVAHHHRQFLLALSHACDLHRACNMVSVTRCVVVCLAVVAVLFTVCVERTSASYGGVMDFSGPVLAAAGVGSEMEMGYGGGGEFGDAGEEVTRRMLAGYAYISYQSLNKGRTPCPARSGRSYYTKNCYKAGKAKPYTRGCTQITRCARA